MMLQPDLGSCTRGVTFTITKKTLFAGKFHGLAIIKGKNHYQFSIDKTSSFAPLMHTVPWTL